MKGFILFVAFWIISIPAGFALSMSPPQRRATSPALKSAAPSRSSRSIPATASRDKSLLARVTVYWASGGKGSDRYTRRHKTATGQRLRIGHCAVDPRHIPYGSKVVLPDGSSLAAVDTGTAVKNRKAARKSGRTREERGAIVIDRFFETKRQALAWAKTHPMFMPVRVVSPNPHPTRQTQSSRAVATSSRTFVGPIRRALPVVQTRDKDRLVASNQSSASYPPRKVRR